ncbi:MAG: arsenate reductase ArsC [Pontiella sp.]
MPEKISLLYLCTGNSCRSQMAEGWTHALKSDEIEVYSAGIETHGLNPNAVKVMAEAGVDITSQKSQHIDEFKDTKIDYVITVCNAAHESCPWFPADCKVIHVGFDDPPNLSPADAPAAIKLDGFRRVRDEIKAFVDTLPGFLEQ